MKKIILVFFLLFVGLLQAQQVNPLHTKDFIAQQVWVDSILKNMTIEEKIGQLFMVAAYSNKGEKHERFVKKMIKEYHIGALIFFQDNPIKQAQLTNTYQSTSKVPLLIGIDGEWGLNMRLKNTYRFPWNMTLGAIRDDKLIKDFGKQVGKHCKRLGIHINFAPVIDVNTNPKNPIIGNRSFGENHIDVAQKGVAFTNGIQSEGVLACAKHFPGHGDTATDSHKTLPKVTFSKKRIDSIELYPYKETFKAGITSIMVAHLEIPSLDATVGLPSTLSKPIVTNLLQQKLGFKGLIITDAMNMKGAANFSSSEEINLQAILAGNDLLDVPLEIPKTVKIFKEALKRGKLSMLQLENSVKKILKAKYWAGLHHYLPIKIAGLENDLISPSDEILHRKLIKNSLTILKNENGDVPIRKIENKKIAYISFGDKKGKYFFKMLKKYTKVAKVSDENLHGLMKKLDGYNLVIIGFHKSNKNPWKSYKFTNKELVWIQEIARKKNVILDIFASPYSLLKVKSFANIEGLIVSYQNSKLAQELSAQLIFGAIEGKGKLPVSIRNEFGVGHGLISTNLKRLQYSIPEDVGMSSKKLALIEKYADTLLTKKMAPGFQVLVARYGKVVYHKTWGYHTDKKLQKVKKTDVYDLASVTKILGTLPMVMKAYEEGKFTLDTELQTLLPVFKNSNKDTVTAKEILSHVARLKAWIPFYIKTQDSITKQNLNTYYHTRKSKNFSIKIVENLYLMTSYKDSIIKYIKEADQRERIGYKYSDLAFYIFKQFIEKTYKKRLDTLSYHHFYKLIGANSMGYLPLNRMSEKKIIPTEKDNYFRHQLLRGYVHDMGAAMQDGVGGHAGLFANANDVAKMMQMYLQKGYYGGKHYFKDTTIDVFNNRYFADKLVRRGVGFDKPQLNPDEKATCGCVSNNSFGHSGFTGVYTWADPKSGLLYVFMSNRVYPNMANRGLVTSNMRTKIQQVIQDAINLKE